MYKKLEANSFFLRSFKLFDSAGFLLSPSVFESHQIPPFTVLFFFFLKKVVSEFWFLLNSATIFQND